MHRPSTNRLGTLAVLALLHSAPLAVAQEIKSDERSHVRNLATGEKSPPAKIDDVAWIAGNWVGNAMGGTSEEIWTPPRAGTMMGMFRQIGDQGVQFYELMTISESEGSLLLRIKHFHPDLKGWEEKDDSRVFPLVKLEEKTAYFDGLTFEKHGDGNLTIWVKIKRTSGEVSEMEFPLKQERR
jgi:Domain of unknown function (DUF6265)